MTGSAVPGGRGGVKRGRRSAPLPLHLSVLGMPAMTAYFGLLDVGQPKPGNTVVVSAAAGARGSAVGRVPKIKRFRLVVSVCGPVKIRYIVAQLRFSAGSSFKR